MDWDVLFKQLFFAMLRAMPRLFGRIKHYFTFVSGIYKKQKQAIDKTDRAVIIYTSGGKRDTLREIAKKFGIVAWPVTVWIGLLIVIPAAVLFGMYIGIRLLLPIVITIIAIIAFIISWFEERHAQEGTLNWQILDTKRLNVRQALFFTLRELGTLLPLKPLSAASEIRSEVEQRPHSVLVTSYVLKNGEVMKEDTDRAEAQLQVTLNKRLKEGLIPEFPYYSYDTTADERDRVYTLTVESVQDAGVELRIDIMIADTTAAINYARSMRKPPPSSPGGGKDRDF